MFEKGHIDTGFANRAWLPSLGRADDGTIYCAWSLDVKVIYVCRSHDAGKTWSKSVKVMECPRPGDLGDPNVLCVGKRVTVFASFGPAPRPPYTSIDTLASSSDDGGETWSAVRVVPIPRKYVCGRCQPPIRLDEKAIAMGYSYDVPAEEGHPVSEEQLMHLRAGVLLSHDEGQTWSAGGDIDVSIANIGVGDSTGADEPAIVRLSNGDLFAIVRTYDTHPYETRSHDGGLTWDTPKPSRFFGHNSPSALLRLSDGAIVRAWDNSPEQRFPLVASLSTDDGRTWTPPCTITEPTAEASFGEASYPTLVQAADGTIVVSWWETDAHGSNVGVARFDRKWLEEAKAGPVIVAFGDSVTLGARPGIAEAETFRARLQAKLRDAGVAAKVANAGIGGSNTRDALARMDRDVVAEEPRVVIVMFGLNDAAMVDGGPVARTEPRVSLAEYRENLTHIVRRAKRAGAQVVLCTPTPMSRAYPYEKLGAYGTHEDINFLLREYAQAAREVADAEHVPLVDLFALFTERPDGLKLIEDGNHPWPAGHALIVERLFAPVRAALAAATKGSRPVHGE